MSWDDLVQRVRVLGEYATRREAERVLRTVLSMLGGHLAEAERAELGRCLPQPAATLLGGQPPANRPLTAAEFVDTLAALIDGATHATARWDASSVLATLAEPAGDDLIRRIIDRLPSGYALLFGKPELTPA